jgi:hypothetical protein
MAHSAGNACTGLRQLAPPPCADHSDPGTRTTTVWYGGPQHTMGSAAPLIEEAPAPVEYEQRHQQLAASTAAAAEAPVERELPPVPNMPVPGQVRAPGGRGSLYHQQGGESPLLASDPYSAVQARYR